MPVSGASGSGKDYSDSYYRGPGQGATRPGSKRLADVKKKRTAAQAGVDAPSPAKRRRLAGAAGGSSTAGESSGSAAQGELRDKIKELRVSHPDLDDKALAKILHPGLDDRGIEKLLYPHLDDTDFALLDKAPSQPSRPSARLLNWENRPRALVGIEGLQLPTFGAALYAGFDWNTEEYKPYKHAMLATSSSTASLGATRDSFTERIRNKPYRAKQILHGDFAAHSEFFFGRLLRLYGFLKNIPNVELVNNTANVIQTHEQRKLFEPGTDPNDCLCVASEMDGSFQDLGPYLKGEEPLGVIKDEKDRIAFQTLQGQVRALIEEKKKLSLSYVLAHPDAFKDTEDDGLPCSLADAGLSEQQMVSLLAMEDARERLTAFRHLDRTDGDPDLQEAAMKMIAAREEKFEKNMRSRFIDFKSHNGEPALHQKALLLKSISGLSEKIEATGLTAGQVAVLLCLSGPEREQKHCELLGIRARELQARQRQALEGIETAVAALEGEIQEQLRADHPGIEGNTLEMAALMSKTLALRHVSNQSQADYGDASVGLTESQMVNILSAADEVGRGQRLWEAKGTDSSHPTSESTLRMQEGAIERIAARVKEFEDSTALDYAGVSHHVRRLVAVPRSFHEERQEIANKIAEYTKKHYALVDKQFNLLPEYLKESYDELSVAKAVIAGEWDLYNEDFMNTGTSIEENAAKSVDNGNLGPQGHMGMPKEESLAIVGRANQRHQPFQPLGMLKFWELGFGKDFAETDDGLPITMTALSTAARSRHYAPLLRNLVENEREARSDRLGHNTMATDKAGKVTGRAVHWPAQASGSQAPVAMLRIGWRALCMTDDVLERFVDRFWMVDRPGYPTLGRQGRTWQLPSGTKKLEDVIPDRAQILAALKLHNQQIVATLGDQAKHWAQQNPREAHEIRASVVAGVTEALVNSDGSEAFLSEEMTEADRLVRVAMKPAAWREGNTAIDAIATPEPFPGGGTFHPAGSGFRSG